MGAIEVESSGEGVDWGLRSKLNTVSKSVEPASVQPIDPMEFEQLFPWGKANLPLFLQNPCPWPSILRSLQRVTVQLVDIHPDSTSAGVIGIFRTSTPSTKDDPGLASR